MLDRLTLSFAHIEYVCVCLMAGPHWWCSSTPLSRGYNQKFLFMQTATATQSEAESKTRTFLHPNTNEHMNCECWHKKHSTAAARIKNFAFGRTEVEKCVRAKHSDKHIMFSPITEPLVRNICAVCFTHILFTLVFDRRSRESSGSCRSATWHER